MNLSLLFLSVLVSCAFAQWLEHVLAGVEHQWWGIAPCRKALRVLAIAGGVWLIGVAVMAGVGR